METCELCERYSPILSWDRPCCRARFLLGLPNRVLRSGWLARWREKGESEMAEAVEKIVRAKWAA
jgi:hypothetical protein